MTKLSDCIGLFSVRKILRFELTPLFATAERLQPMLSADEDRAAALYKTKAVIEAEHLTMVRRVFETLSDPMPADPRVIVRAAQADPEYAMLHGSDAGRVLGLVVDRCRRERRPLPSALKDLLPWSSLYVKWHWHCAGRLDFKGAKGLARAWAGRSKADVLSSCAAMKPSARRKISRSYWYDHGAFRMMFGNRFTGYGWRTGDFPKARQFLLRDGDRILVGIVPRDSRANPFEMPEPSSDVECYGLYCEQTGALPILRRIAKATVDRAAQGGGILLFEVSGRAMRGRGNLNAHCLRALLSDENLARPKLHLDAESAFYVRKGADFGGARPAAFRQRFTRRMFSAEFVVTCNASLVGLGKHPVPFRPLSQALAESPSAKVIEMSPVDGGFRIWGHTADGASNFDLDGGESLFVSTANAYGGHLAGQMARLVVAHDAHALVPQWLPREIRQGILEKFGYVVLRERAPAEDGGVLRGYQLNGRLVTGKWKKGPKVESASAAAPSVAPPDALRPAFDEGAVHFRYTYCDSSHVRHTGELRADSKDEAFGKLRTVGIRPIRVLADGEDALPVRAEPTAAEKAAARKALKKGGRAFVCVYQSHENKQLYVTVRADTREDAYRNLRTLGIRPIKVEELASGF